MLMRFFAIALFFFFPFCLQMGSSFAVDYTTGLKDKEVGRTTVPTRPEKKKECTREDMFSIKKFDHKVRSAIKKYNKVSESNIKGNDTKAVERTMKEMFDYFVSDKYLAMKKVYGRCNIEMPSIKKKKPFWQPDR